MNENSTINWKEIFRIFSNQEFTFAQITKYNGNGFLVTVLGVNSFLPNISKSIGVENPEDAVGMNVPIFITKIIPLNNQIVISYKKEAVDRINRIESIKDVQVGSVWNGTIKNIVSYGCFVTIAPGLDGLLHSKEISWDKNFDIKSNFKEGDIVTVKVIGMQDDKVMLGMKQLVANPWDALDKSYQVGTKLNGLIRDIQDYGAFIEIIPGVEALLHKTEISWDVIGSVRDYYSIGEKVEVLILTLDREKHLMTVSAKQLREDPWLSIESNLSVNDVIECYIYNIRKNGLNVRLKSVHECYIPLSELIFSNKIKDIFEEYHIGDKIMVKILNIDIDKRKIYLTMRI